MSKLCLIFQLLFHLIISIEIHNPIKLVDFSRTKFTLDNEYVILEYSNNIEKNFNYEINFIFDEGNKPSTKVYYYDSKDKIERGETGFINYLYLTSLKETRILKIPYDAPYYSNKTTYYIVLYDISITYTDYVYLLNSLTYLPLKDSIYYHNTFKFELHFNFLVQENEIKYLHYQSRAESGVLPYASSYFRITNENGERFIDKNCFGVSGFIEIKPFIKYYIEIALYGINIFDERELMLKLEKYGEYIPLEEDKEIEMKILFPQGLFFFKSISNLTVNESIYFNFRSLHSTSHGENIYIKLYDSDNFERLLSLFPSQREDFDNKIGYIDNGGDFHYDLNKTYNSQKGVLFGVFIDRTNSYYSLETTTIFANITRKKEDEKKDGKKDDKNSDKSSDDENSSSNVVSIIMSIISSLIIIAVIVYCCKTGKCDDCSKNSYSSNSYYDVDDDSSEYGIAIVKIKKRKY